MYSNKLIAIRYAIEIKNNYKAASKQVKLACSRFLADLKSDKYYFDANAVDEVISFLSNLYLLDQATPTKFNPEPWQIFIIANIYGIKKVSNNRRKYRYIYIEVPRKNGKSFLINSLAIYHLIFDPDSQIVVSANSREQAKNVDFKQIKRFCSQVDPKKKHLKQYYNNIKFENNELIVTASDSLRLDGLNASVAIIDELHAAPDSSMYDVLKSSQGARTEPLLMSITTAGFERNSFCYQLKEYNEKVLNGEIIDESQFSIIYTLDEGDSIEDKKNWQKANPNLDISVFSEFIESEVNKAVNNPIELSGVKVKNFNVWLQSNSDEQYIDESYVKASFQKFEIEDIIKDNQDIELTVGVDLASTSDFTAVSVMFVSDAKLYFKNYLFIPEVSVNTKKDNKWYKQMAEQGYIYITSGNVTDYDYIISKLKEIRDIRFINQVFYDSWNATQFAISATEQDFNMIPFSQGNQSMNRPTKELSRLLMSNQVIIDENPVIQWMFNNCIIKETGRNIKVDKAKSANKIDGVYAMLNALGGFLDNDNYSFDII